MHESVGVESINEITRGKFQEAAGALLAYRDRHIEQARAQTRVGRVLQAANDKGLYQELMNYCSREFGEQQLKALSTSQLSQAMTFVDSYVQPAKVEEPTRQKQALIDLRLLLLSYPWQLGGVLFTGFVLGKLF